MTWMGVFDTITWHADQPKGQAVEKSEGGGVQSVCLIEYREPDARVAWARAQKRMSQPGYFEIKAADPATEFKGEADNG